MRTFWVAVSWVNGGTGGRAVMPVMISPSTRHEKATTDARRSRNMRFRMGRVHATHGVVVWSHGPPRAGADRGSRQREFHGAVHGRRSDAAADRGIADHEGDVGRDATAIAARQQRPGALRSSSTDASKMG